MQQLSSFELLPDNVKRDLWNRHNRGDSSSQCINWLRANGYHTASKRSLQRYFKRNNALAAKINIRERVETDKTRESQKAETDYYRRLYYQAIKDSVGMDKVVSVATNITAAIPKVTVKYKAPLIIATSSQSAVAPLCDTHIGEEIDIEQMGGLNSYNMDIFNKRLHGWAEQVVNLVEFRRSYTNIHKLYVPMLGDMVSGDIHLELVKTNLDNVMGQMIRGAHMISQALVSFAPHFEGIIVPCVVGNHGRMTIKPPSKDKYLDWDFLMYQWIAAFCRNQPNIKFSIPKSFLHVFEVEGRKILIMHGDSITMWQSVPFYGMTRAFAQLRQTLQFRRGLEEDVEKLAGKKAPVEELFNVLSSYFDSVMIGHFHQSSELDIGTGVAFVCGCLKGGDEYSFGRLHTISRPSQLLTYWHPKYGYISKDIIYLERYDDNPDKFVDALPGVWADVELSDKKLKLENN